MKPQVENKKNKGKSPKPKKEDKKLEIVIPPAQKYKNGQIIQNYQIVHFIQMGAYGQVFKVRRLSDKDKLDKYEEHQNVNEEKNQDDLENIFAMKCISKENIGKDELKRLIVEKEIMSKINHENIVQLHDFFDLEGYNDFFMIQDYCEGEDLLCEVNSQLCFEIKRIEESQVISYLAQLLRGFKILHWYKIMHRDMKPENVLKNDIISNHIQICDFGLICFGVEEAMTAAGTKYYVAPEICDIYEWQEKQEENKGRKRKTSFEIETMLLSHSFSQNLIRQCSTNFEAEDLEYDSKVDIFGIACVIYECLFLTRVLKVKKGENPILELRNAYKKTGKDLYFPKETKCSDIMKDLLIRMTEPDASARISWENLFNHKVVKDYTLQYEFEEATKKNNFVEVLDSQLISAGFDDLKKLTDPYPLYFPCETVDISINERDQKGTLFKVSNDYYKELTEHIKKTKSSKKLENIALTNKQWFVVIYPHTADKKKKNKKKGNSKDEKNYIIVYVDKKPIDLFIEFHNQTEVNLDYFRISGDYTEREHIWTLQPSTHKRFKTEACLTWEVYKSADNVMIDREKNENLQISYLRSSSQKSINPEDPLDSIYPLYSISTPLSKDEFIDNIIRLETKKDFKIIVEKVKKTEDTSNSKYKHDLQKKVVVRSPYRRKLSGEMLEIRSESEEKSDTYSLKDESLYSDEEVPIHKSMTGESTNQTENNKNAHPNNDNSQEVREFQNTQQPKINKFCHYEVQLRFLFNTYEEFYLFVKRNEIFKKEYGAQAILILYLLLSKAMIIKNYIQLNFSQVSDNDKTSLNKLDDSIKLLSKEFSELNEELKQNYDLNDYYKSFEKIDNTLKEAILNLQSYRGEECVTYEELENVKESFCLATSKLYITIRMKQYFIDQSKWDHVWENNFDWRKFDNSYDKDYVKDIVKLALKFISFSNIKSVTM